MMSKSGQWYIAATEGTQFTLSSAMRRMGIPLSEEQEEFQAYLEAHYPPVVNKDEVNDERLGEAGETEGVSKS